LVKVLLATKLKLKKSFTTNVLKLLKSLGTIVLVLLWMMKEKPSLKKMIGDYYRYVAESAKDKTL